MNGKVYTFKMQRLSNFQQIIWKSMRCWKMYVEYNICLIWTNKEEIFSFYRVSDSICHWNFILQIRRRWAGEFSLGGNREETMKKLWVTIWKILFQKIGFDKSKNSKSNIHLNDIFTSSIAIFTPPLFWLAKTWSNHALTHGWFTMNW